MFALIQDSQIVALAPVIPQGSALDYRPVVDGTKPGTTTAYSTIIERPFAEWTVGVSQVERTWTEYIPPPSDQVAIQAARDVLPILPKRKQVMEILRDALASETEPDFTQAGVSTSAIALPSHITGSSGLTQAQVDVRVVVGINATDITSSAELAAAIAANPGPTGPAGSTGPQGPAGTAGATGAQGPAGNDGAAGAQGIQGPQGATGSTGAASTVPGPTGAQGIQGIQGLQGIPGVAGTNGYAINVQALTSSPVDSQTIYFGTLPKAPITTANVSKIYIRAAGTIKRAEIYCFSGTAGTAESWSISIRKNNTTDTLIATVAAAANERVFTNSALNIAVAAGDYIEIKAVNPLWATNPLTTIFGGYIYVENA